LRSRESFLIAPDELTHLPIGDAAIGIRFGRQRVAVVRVDRLRLIPPINERSLIHL
jgi:hypothetical protein